MKWNYTKTWFFLAWGAVAVGIATGGVAGKIVGALCLLPVVIIADVRHHKKSLLQEVGGPVVGAADGLHSAD